MSLVCSALTWPMWCRAVLGFPLHTGAYWLSQFRQQLAVTLGCSASMIWLFGAGRMGLYRLAAALGLQANDEVLLPAYTCVVVPNALHFAGATLRYVDIDQQTLNYQWEALLEACHARTRMLVLPANFGLQGDLSIWKDRLLQLKNRYPRLVIVADMAHGLGDRAEHDLGALADAAFYSFEFSKCLTTGMGGALRINQPELASVFAQSEAAATLTPPSGWMVLRLMATIKSHLLAASGWPRLGRWSQGILRRVKLLYATPAEELQGKQPKDYPLAMSAFGACLGLQQLNDYTKTLELRRRQAAAYRQVLSSHQAVCLPEMSTSDDMLRFPVMLSAKAQANGWDRARLINHLGKQTGISVGVWFNDVIHPAGSYRHGYLTGSCPVGEQVAATMMNLPLGRHMVVDAALLTKLRQALDEVVA